MSNPLSPGSIIREINGNAVRPFTAVIHNGKSAEESRADYIRSLREKRRVSLTETIPKPPVCLFIDGVRVGTLGNFSVVIGKPKTRKTRVMGSFAAAAVSPGKTQVGGIEAAAPVGRNVLAYFDTEQVGHDVQDSLRRICKQAGNDDPSNLLAYGLRGMSVAEMLEVIEQTIYETPDLYMVFIDGVRDLVQDINSAEEATTVSRLLLKWTEERDIHIVTLIHQNKGDNNARGHLGTELVNKAETVMSVTKGVDGNNLFSTVSPEQCRSIDFEPFSFGIDDQDMPYTVDGPEPTTASGRTKPRQLVDTEITTILLRAFAKDHELAYRQLCTNLIESAQFIGVDLGKSKAEQLIARLYANETLTKGRTAKQRWDFYQIKDRPPITAA